MKKILFAIMFLILPVLVSAEFDFNQDAYEFGDYSVVSELVQFNNSETVYYLAKIEISGVVYYDLLKYNSKYTEPKKVHRFSNKDFDISNKTGTTSGFEIKKINNKLYIFNKAFNFRNNKKTVYSLNKKNNLKKRAIKTNFSKRSFISNSFKFNKELFIVFFSLTNEAHKYNLHIYKTKDGITWEHLEPQVFKKTTGYSVISKKIGSSLFFQIVEDADNLYLYQNNDFVKLADDTKLEKSFAWTEVFNTNTPVVVKSGYKLKYYQNNAWNDTIQNKINEVNANNKMVVAASRKDDSWVVSTNLKNFYKKELNKEQLEKLYIDDINYILEIRKFNNKIGLFTNLKALSDHYSYPNYKHIFISGNGKDWKYIRAKTYNFVSYKNKLIFPNYFLNYNNLQNIDINSTKINK
ncbi:MAG: hypothetical protein V1898_04925 [Patescibacteria group bacterium]